MSLRLDHKAELPEGFLTLLEFEKSVLKMGLDRKLVELMKIRASQINGCTYCLDMHWQNARKNGETEKRLSVLTGWRETGLFTGKEMAALALTESATRISEHGVPDEVYDEVQRHFSKREFVALIMVINAINAWNRIAVATGMRPPMES